MTFSAGGSVTKGCKEPGIWQTVNRSPGLRHLISFIHIFAFALATRAEDESNVRDVSFVAECDQTTQKYVIVLPGDFSPQTKYDIVIALHGHGSDRWQFIRQQRDECRAVRDFAQRMGMLLVAPDYRSKTSWMGPKAEADVLQIIKELREQYSAGRIFLCGGSMGGTACLTFAALHPKSIDGVASMNGTANLLEYDNFQDAIAASFGGTKVAIPGEYKRRSAEYWPERFTMPLSVAVGGRDQTVPGGSVLRLANVVSTIGNEDVLVIHRDQGGHSTSYSDATALLQWIVDAQAPLPQLSGKHDSVDGNDAIHFQKLVLTDSYYCDGVSSGDFNGDGNEDLVAGPFWYEGPTFEKSHAFYEPVKLDAEESPSNSMFSFVHDFSGDGLPDILVLGRVHKHSAIWYQNPGKSDGLWESHFAFDRVKGESPTLVDLDGDGVPQVICHWNGSWGSIQPDASNPKGPWKFLPLGSPEDWPQFYHGQGVGDINGDGIVDLILNDGWYQQPNTKNVDSVLPTWKFHRGKFSKGRGGAQMFADDVDGDGDQDVISAVDAHGWGVAWYEQITAGGSPQFREHLIMGDRLQLDRFGAAFTQPHALALADVNGDGLADIITGKRRWAHGPDGDIEPAAPPVVYWFELRRDKNGVRYIPHKIDDQSGVGVQVLATDLNQDGRIDVATASKLGTFVFLQLP